MQQDFKPKEAVYLPKRLARIIKHKATVLLVFVCTQPAVLNCKTPPALENTI